MKANAPFPSLLSGFLLLLLAMLCPGCHTQPVKPPPSNASTSIAAQWLVSRTGATTADIAPMPRGRNPETGDVTASVVNVDPSYRMLKLQRADGKTEEFKIELPAAELGSVRPGALVVIRATNGPLLFKSE